MILDRLDCVHPYRSLGRGFADGFDYLQRTDFSAIADGRYAIDGGALIAIVQTYSTKPPAQGRWEAHRRHADIQFIDRGREHMRVAPRGSMNPITAYEADRDLEFFSGADGQEFLVESGGFAIFFPHDVHMPGLSVNAIAEVKKVVIKVPLE